MQLLKRNGTNNFKIIPQKCPSTIKGKLIFILILGRNQSDLLSIFCRLRVIPHYGHAQNGLAHSKGKEGNNSLVAPLAPQTANTANRDFMFYDGVHDVINDDILFVRS